MKRLAIIETLLLSLAASCTGIFEDRDACPSRIFLDLEEDRGLDHRSHLSYVIQDAGGEEEATGETTLGELGEQYTVKVPKGHLYAFGTVGAESARVSSFLYIIPGGSDCGPLYHFFSQADAYGESCRIPVRLNKEFSVLDISFAPEDGERVNPYGIGIRSNWCGMDLSTGKPLRGLFHTFPEEMYEGHFTCRIPRQGGRGLMLDLYAKEGTGGFDKGLIDSIDLWRLVDAIEGFSWQDESLQDISIVLDISRSQVTATVGQWEIVQSLTITI